MRLLFANVPASHERRADFEARGSLQTVATLLLAIIGGSAREALAYASP